MEFEDIDQEGWILMLFGFFLLINSSSRLTLYRNIVAAVKETIDKQCPHAKLLLKSGVLFSERALLVIASETAYCHCL